MGNYTRKDNETMKAWANRVNGSVNKYKVHCIIDGHAIEAGQGKAICLPEAGKEPRYVCSDCFDNLTGREFYHFNSEQRELNQTEAIGTIKKGIIESNTIGLEIEHVFDRYSDRAFYTFKFIVQRCFNVVEESDCTVSGEFPTEKMNGANKASSMIRKLEKYGFIEYLDDESVGAHIHVACTCIEYIRNWYNTLFVPLCEYLMWHNEEWMIENFGRGFGAYRTAINNHSSSIAHGNFINCQHNHTLEFRLPRIHTANQYINNIYFFREVVSLLNNTAWIEKGFDNRVERKMQAVAISHKIVKIARKYFGD